jgi:hypothetical protein
MKSRWMLRVYGSLAVLSLLFAMGSRSMAAQKADSEQINKLFSDARSYALQAEEHAEQLDSYTHSKLSWETHAGQLNQMREHFNDLGKVAKQLTDMRAEGSPWQQDAIDRIDPLLRDWAAQLTATINHLNANQSRIHMQPYLDYTQATYDLSTRTARMISDFVDFGKSRARAASLEQKLELPAN